MFAFAILLAEAAKEETAPTFFQGPLPMLLMLGVLFYFLMIRPMQRQAKEQQSMQSGLKKKDRVVTSGGIIGVVDQVKEKEDEVTLRIDENSNVRLRVTKSSIVRVLTASADEGGKDKDSKEDGE